MSLAVGLTLAFAALHARAVFTESINWDEFALFARAVDSRHSGALTTGGRPGLGVLALFPLVSGCTSEIETVHAGRLIWLGWMALAAIALWLLVFRVLADRPWRGWAASASVGLWLLVPAVQRWSLQVRTDQPAVALGLMGALGLLAARRHWRYGLLAGALFAMSFLFTQKGIYVAALGGLLWVMDESRSREWRPWRSWRTMSTVAAGALATWLVYVSAVRRLFSIPDPLTVNRMAEIYGNYSGMSLDALVGAAMRMAPHLILALLLMGASVAAWRRSRSDLRLLLTSWLVLALGGAVVLFHPSPFVYFWITLGIFPAVALGVAVPQIVRWVPRRVMLAGLVGAVVLLAGEGMTAALLLQQDTQAVQRASLDFVRRSFSDDQAGFQPERALFCRDGARPFATYFSLRIGHEFGAPGRSRAEDALLTEFRGRPVYYIVQSYRLGQFPPRIRDFWQQHYMPYRASVAVLGVRFDGDAGTRISRELLADGDYRLLLAAPDDPGSVLVDGVALANGETAKLAAGPHEIELLGRQRGVLVWALDEPPRDAPRDFYGRSMLEEFVRGRTQQ